MSMAFTKLVLNLTNCEGVKFSMTMDSAVNEVVQSKIDQPASRRILEE